MCVTWPIRARPTIEFGALLGSINHFYHSFDAKAFGLGNQLARRRRRERLQVNAFIRQRKSFRAQMSQQEAQNESAQWLSRSSCQCRRGCTCTTRAEWDGCSQIRQQQCRWRYNRRCHHHMKCKCKFNLHRVKERKEAYSLATCGARKIKFKLPFSLKRGILVFSYTEDTRQLPTISAVCVSKMVMASTVNSMC